MKATIDQARAAKSKLSERLKSRGDVVGVGIGRDDASYCVKVNLRRAKSGDLPDAVDGVAVRYEVVGTVRPLRAK